jgi:DNA-directed RNA polymerase beta subunit
MIQFKNWRQYTHVVNGVRFPQNVKEPFLLVYFGENSSFTDDYPYLNLKRIDYRLVVIPTTTIPRTRLTSELRKSYTNYGLIPYPMQQKVPANKNVIVDLSQYLGAIDKMYKPTTYRQRPGFLMMNALTQAFGRFPGNYQKILLYSVNTKRAMNSFTNRKSFPLVRDIKKGEQLPFDHMIMCYMGDAARYRLLIKDGDYRFQRVLHYLKTVTSTPMDEEIDNTTKQAARIVSKVVDKNLDPGSKSKVRGAIEDFLKSDEDETIKITSGDATKGEVIDTATASILAGVSGDIDKAKAMTQNIPAKRKLMALKAVDKNFAAELLKPHKTINLSTDPSISAYSPEKLVRDKSPEHIYEKRKVDFEKNLKKDLTNSFKVLEKEDIPIKIEKINLVQKPQRAGELMKSDINIANVTLKDKFGNVHNIKMELPRIDPDTGTFRLYGQKKCLVNQLTQCPITFPKPGQSRFESSYSVFRIYSKQLRREKYLEGFMTYKMPLIFLLSYAFGFEQTLKKYKIKYEFTDVKPKGETFISKIPDGRFIVFKNVNTELKRQLCQSFLRAKLERSKIAIEFGTKEFFEKWIIEHTGRINSTFQISQQVKNVIDPVAKQVLMNKQLPFELERVMEYMATKVVENYVIERNDLNNLRIRNSEVLVHLAQKQILAAYTTYKAQVLSGNTEAELVISPTKVLSDFLKTELVVNMEYANPMEEMATMTRVSPVGKKVGGIPDKRAISEAGRNIHSTYFGNIDPLDTPEGENIGLIQQLTIDAMITSSRGLFGEKNITNTEGAGMLSATSAMIPFIENTDGARVIMATNQAKQCLPLKNPQTPPVMSGYESILPSVLSSSFIKRAPCTGKITRVTEHAIYLKCDGRSQSVDITPAHLKSGSGKDTLSVFKPTVISDQNVKKGQIIAEGACMANGTISMGRPLLTAMMAYKGYNFEDGIAISQSVADQDKLTSLHGIEEEVLVSENDRLMYIGEIGQYIEKGQPLLRKTMGDVEEIIGFEDDDSTDLLAGQYIKKSPGGRIVDILVYSNVAPSKFPKLKELADRTAKRYGKPSKEKFSFKGETIKGVLINFKIEQELVVGVGDKLAGRYGNKGIISIIEKDELMPRMPNGDHIEIVLNPIGVVNRMNISQLYEMYTGLISKEMAKRIVSLGTKSKVIDLIKKVYSQLDTSPNKRNTTTLVAGLNRLSVSNFKVLIDQVTKSGFYPIIVPPFQSPNHKHIRGALGILGLKSGYKLTLPEYNTKTAREVPCGYMYMTKLEHLGSEKIYARSTGPVTGKTGQPTSGKSREGGQRLGELDTYAFISYDAPHVLAEFMGPLSDDYITREEILAEIIQKGEAEYKEPKVSPGKELLNSYFVSLMLER